MTKLMPSVSVVNIGIDTQEWRREETNDDGIRENHGFLTQPALGDIVAGRKKYDKFKIGLLSKLSTYHIVL